MPTAEIFSLQPPFPDDLPTWTLPKLSYAKLLAYDPEESRKLFQASIDTGFFSVDLRDTPEGESFIYDAVGVLELDQEVSALHYAEKSRYNQPQQRLFPLFGHKAAGSMKLETGEADRAEFYSVSQDCLLSASDPQTHPKPIERSKPLLKSFVLHGYDLSTLILGHLDNHLHLPHRTLASLHCASKPSMTTVRLIHVAPQSVGNGKKRAALFGHTDNGSVTVLFNVIGGLQILPPGLANEECNWRWVRPEPGCAIVNLGDVLVQWSGGILRSNMHRVLYAPGEQAECERYSSAYVLKPDNEASMEKLVRTSKEDDVDDQYTYKAWLGVKSLASAAGKNLVKVSNIPKVVKAVDMNTIREGAASERTYPISRPFLTGNKPSLGL